MGNQAVVSCKSVCASSFEVTFASAPGFSFQDSYFRWRQ